MREAIKHDPDGGTWTITRRGLLELARRSGYDLVPTGSVRRLTEALQGMLVRFAPSDDGLSEAEIACVARARAALEEVDRG